MLTASAFSNKRLIAVGIAIERIEFKRAQGFDRIFAVRFCRFVPHRMLLRCIDEPRFAPLPVTREAGPAFVEPRGAAGGGHN